MFSTNADAGYYAETSDSEDREGIIAFNSFFEQYNEYADEITQYGIYIYKTGAEDNKVSLSAATVDELIASEGKFYALVTGIAADSFNSVVAAMPYVVIGDKTITGDVCTYSVSQSDKWLGPKSITEINETEEMNND